MYNILKELYLTANPPKNKCITTWDMLSKINKILERELNTIDGLSDQERRKLWEDHIWETL